MMVSLNQIDLIFVSPVFAQGSFLHLTEELLKGRGLWVPKKGMLEMFDLRMCIVTHATVTVVTTA